MSVISETTIGAVNGMKGLCVAIHANGGATIKEGPVLLSIARNERVGVALALLGPPDEAMVERTARHLLLNFPGGGIEDDWEALSDDDRDGWRQEASAMLESAFGGGEQAE